MKKKRQNHGVFDFDNFEVRRQYRIASLCNQLLPECSSNQFEKLHRCCKHIEDVRATFNGRKIFFYKISDLDNFQYSVVSLCDQLLQGYTVNRFEALQRCY